MPTADGEETVDLIRRQPLDSEGVCTKCAHKADNEAMQCFGCSEYYHVIKCPPGNDRGQVTNTFFRGWDNMIQNYKNIQYICDACILDKKLKNDIIISNRMCVMEEEMKGIKNNMEEHFKSLEDIVTKLVTKNEVPVPVESQDQRPTYADMVNKPHEKPKQSVIVIKKKGNGDAVDMDKVYKAAVHSNAAVAKAYKNTVGDTVVVCEDEKSKESILPVLEGSIDKNKYNIVTPVSKLPTVTIINMASNYSKSDLLLRVKSQNAARLPGIDINENNFKVIFTRAQVKNSDLFKAVVRVSDEVREAIEKGGNTLNIGLTSCPVYDDFFIKRCNRCQSFKHWKESCPRTTPVVCGKCSGNHETRLCTSDVVKCANCASHKFPDTAHETSYYKCRAYTEAQDKLRSTIPYYRNKPKN